MRSVASEIISTRSSSGVSMICFHASTMALLVISPSRCDFTSASASPTALPVPTFCRERYSPKQLFNGSGFLGCQVDGQEPSLFPTSWLQWQVKMPGLAIGQRSQLHSFPKAILQQLLLVICQVLAQPFYLYEHGVGRTRHQGVVDAAASHRVFWRHLRQVE